MHTTTKLRTAFAAIAMMLCISSAAQGTDIAEKIMQDTERLIGSAAFAHTMQHDGQGIYTDHFKYTLSEEEMDDTAFLPDELRRLSQTLYEAVPIAPVALSHRSGGVASPVDCLGFYWPNKYETVAFSYPLPEKLNYQFVTFTGADGLRRCYGLAYHKVEFTDLAGKPYKCIDGYVLKLTGNHWNIFTNVPNHNKKEGHYVPGIGGMTSEDGYRNAATITKLQSIEKMFKEAAAKQDSKNMDAMAYVADKTLTDGRPLSRKECQTIEAVLQNMLGMASTDAQRVILTNSKNALKSMNNFWRKESRHVWNCHPYLLPEWRYKMIYFTMPQAIEPQEAELKWELTCTGCSMTDGVTVSLMPYENTKRQYGNRRDTITYSGVTYGGQFAVILTDDATRKWVVVTDSVPVVMDIMTGEAEAASELNRRFLDCQRHIRRIEGEARKYSTSTDDYIVITDPEGMRRVSDSIYAYIEKTIEENSDNMIATYLLAENYPVMKHSSLRRLMKEGAAALAHPMAVPARRYYEGQKLRQPGCRFADAVMEDTLGVSHRLSDIAGKGRYTLLHFWSTDSWWSRRELGHIKQVYRQYADRGLDAVSISLNHDLKDWKKYVTAKGFKWRQMTAPGLWESDIVKAYGVSALPEMVLIGPDGTIVAEDIRGDELKEKMREIFE